MPPDFDRNNDQDRDFLPIPAWVSINKSDIIIGCRVAPGNNFCHTLQLLYR